MTADPFTDRLSELLDGELGEAERVETEAHVRGCDACSALLSELRSVKREARGLARLDPPERVWEAIASEVEREGRSRKRFSRFYQGLALAAVLVLGVALWLALPRAEEPAEDTAALANRVTEELRAAESHYENAISGLEQIIATNQGDLPPELSQTLNQNLDLIEKTIEESRVAMSAEPDSAVAQESLLEAFRRKVSLLQNTILLINELRKGQGENALEIIDEIRRTEESGDRI